MNEEQPSIGLPTATHPRYHHFSFAQIRFFLRAILHLPASLRTAAAIPILLHEEEFGTSEGCDTCTAQCGRLWLLRVGLFEIQRPKVQASDWIWIADHTIQLGPVKVLMIVGLRVSDWERRKRGALKHQDLQVILMEPTEKSDGDIVQAQLERAARVTGVPRAILSDQCRELNKGIRQFRAAHPETAGLNDLKHRLALLLERALKADPRWPKFLETCKYLRKKTQQTTWAFLAPPATKEKARFMNLGELIGWAVRTRLFLDRPQFPAGVNLDSKRLEELCGNLREHDAALKHWHGLIDLIEQSMDVLREEGYHTGLKAKLRSRLALRSKPPRVRKFGNEILEFVAAQSKQARPGEHLPGSSEVLESLIGKGKRLEGQQSKGGFTQMVLGMAAAVVNPTTEYLAKALETVKTSDLAQWAKKNLGYSLQGLRRQTIGLFSAEQIQDKLATISDGNF